jgi:hypothetical protein
VYNLDLALKFRKIQKRNPNHILSKLQCGTSVNFTVNFTNLPQISLIFLKYLPNKNMPLQKKSSLQNMDIDTRTPQQKANKAAKERKA